MREVRMYGRRSLGLQRLRRETKNNIQDSKIYVTVTKLKAKRNIKVFSVFHIDKNHKLTETQTQSLTIQIYTKQCVEFEH